MGKNILLFLIKEPHKPFNSVSFFGVYYSDFCVSFIGSTYFIIQDFKIILFVF